MHVSTYISVIFTHTWFSWEHAHQSREQRMHEAYNLHVSTRHASCQTLVKCFKTSQDHTSRKNLKEERQEIESCAYVGYRVASGGISLRECLQEFSKPWDLDVNV